MLLFVLIHCTHTCARPTAQIHSHAERYCDKTNLRSNSMPMYILYVCVPPSVSACVCGTHTNRLNRWIGERFECERMAYTLALCITQIGLHFRNIAKVKMTQTKTMLDIEMTEFPPYSINRFCLEMIIKICCEKVFVCTRKRALACAVQLSKCASINSLVKRKHNECDTTASTTMVRVSW